jgi:hypothetical protein
MYVKVIEEYGEILCFHSTISSPQAKVLSERLSRPKATKLDGRARPGSPQFRNLNRRRMEYPARGLSSSSRHRADNTGLLEPNNLVQLSSIYTLILKADLHSVTCDHPNSIACSYVRKHQQNFSTSTCPAVMLLMSL